MNKWINRYPGWVESHLRENLTLAEWFDAITVFYQSDFQCNHTGRPSKLTKELAIQLFLEYARTGYMKYALEKIGLHRSTAWRWKQQYRSIDDMYRLAHALNQNHRAEYPFLWKRRRMQRIRLLQRERGLFNSPHKHSRGRPTLYSYQYSKLVKPTMRGTAKELAVCKRTLINWTKKYPEFNKAVLLRRLEWQLPLFDKQYDELAQQVAASTGLSDFLNPGEDTDE